MFSNPRITISHQPPPPFFASLSLYSLLCFDFPSLPYGFGSFMFSSDLSSPIESVVGSTETESDEEDYLAGLTR
jgi:hypothetical protein